MIRRKLARGEKALFASSLIFVAGLLAMGMNASWVRARSRALDEFLQPVQRRRRNSCQANLREIHFVLQEYIQDNDGKYPLAVMGGPKAPPGVPVGWADGFQPWFKSIAGLQCPSAHQLPSFSPHKSGYTSYWMNANLSGIGRERVNSPHLVLEFGEGADGSDMTDGAYSKKILPSVWLSNTSSPLYRHMGTANYLFADGHFKWFTPQEIQAFGGKRDVCDLHQ